MLELIVAVCAVVGAVLGVYNLIHARSQERVRLSVTPKATYPIGRDSSGRIAYKSSTADLIDGQVPEILGVDIVNLSQFDVTVSEVGLNRRRSPMRGAVPNPILPSGGDFPRRLAPRESFTVHLLTENIRPKEFDSVYATTSCGTTAVGSSKAFQLLLHSLPARPAV